MKLINQNSGVNIIYPLMFNISILFYLIFFSGISTAIVFDNYSFFKSQSISASEIKLLSDDGLHGDLFGINVSAHGNRVAVGAIYNDEVATDAGAVYIFETMNGVWSQTHKLIPSDGISDHRFGSSVDIVGDTIMVGATGDNDGEMNSGAVYVFQFNGFEWNQCAKLKASIPIEDAFFGNALELDNNRAIIGASVDSQHGSETGAAFIFESSGCNWIQTSKLISNDPLSYDEFGRSVSLSGNKAIIGARRFFDNQMNIGAAYIFEYDGNNWNQTQKLSASDGSSGDFFGHSVSLDGNRAIVGAYLDETPALDSGSVYVFEYDGQFWNEAAKLMPNDATQIKLFGSSVSLKGDRVLIGSSGNTNQDYNPGSAYVFDFDGVSWQQSFKLEGSDMGAGDDYGRSSILTSQWVIVGSPSNGIYPNYPGAVYIYDLDYVFKDGFEH